MCVISNLVLIFVQRVRYIPSVSSSNPPPRSAASLSERLEARKRLREEMQARKQAQGVVEESGLGKIGLSSSDVLHEVSI